MKRLPVLRQLVKRSKSLLNYVVDLEYNRRFEDWPGSYRGIFDTFAEARASAPNDKIGFDHAELAHLYDARIGKAFPSDYPVLFWLARLQPQLHSVFDWGGHIGVSYYSYTKYLNFSEQLRWRVGDVPQIIQAGAELARKRGADALSFTQHLADADGFDLLLANGSLQFVEEPFSESLQALSRRPAHLLINKLPVYDGPTFITLENTIHSYNPYRVGNRAAFVASIQALGYSLVDEWQTPDVSCHIPLHRERSIEAYSGFYFRLD
ncbi:MAG TPA: methyltransferase, TIGR04325 family [Polyangiaceae bacterium]|nr:methyltransferase, TIGR04325 family [Polyangiaceae bacterium]